MNNTDGCKLTSKERRVLFSISEGMTAKEVAEHLNIGVRTVEWHLKNIYQKLGVSNRSHAVKVAVENGWLKETRS